MTTTEKDSGTSTALWKPDTSFFGKNEGCLLQSSPSHTKNYYPEMPFDYTPETPRGHLELKAAVAQDKEAWEKGWLWRSPRWGIPWRTCKHYPSFSKDVEYMKGED